MSCLASSGFWHGTQSAPYGIGHRVVRRGKLLCFVDVGGCKCVWQGKREGA